MVVAMADEEQQVKYFPTSNLGKIDKGLPEALERPCSVWVAEKRGWCLLAAGHDGAHDAVDPVYRPTFADKDPSTKVRFKLCYKVTTDNTRLCVKPKGHQDKCD